MNTIKQRFQMPHNDLVYTFTKVYDRDSKTLTELNSFKLKLTEFKQAADKASR